MNQAISLVCFLLLSQFVFAQAPTDTINQTDASGQKQGYWAKSYPNGNLAYQVYFKNGKPNGKFRRFHENGTLSALLDYDNNGEFATAEMFDETGLPVARGFYWGQTKDSSWIYYRDEKPFIMESYKHGVNHGRFINYFTDGGISEETTYKHGKKHGVWRQYYQNGQVKIESRFENGEMNGAYNHYTASGRIEVKGRYKADLKDGKWEYYKETGPFKPYRVIEYVDGQATDQAALDSLEQEFFKRIDANQGLLKEPDATEIPGMGQGY